MSITIFTVLQKRNLWKPDLKSNDIFRLNRAAWKTQNYLTSKNIFISKRISHLSCYWISHLQTAFHSSMNKKFRFHHNHFLLSFESLRWKFNKQRINDSQRLIYQAAFKSWKRNNPLDPQFVHGWRNICSSELLRW